MFPRWLRLVYNWPGMSTAVESVVSQLSASGIIAPEKLEPFVPPQASPKDVAELVDSLVQQKRLTRFQAQQIKAGKLSKLVLGAYTLLDTLGAGGMAKAVASAKTKHLFAKLVGGALATIIAPILVAYLIKLPSCKIICTNPLP